MPADGRSATEHPLTEHLPGTTCDNGTSADRPRVFRAGRRAGRLLAYAYAYVYAVGVSRSRPPTYGRSLSGMITEPSACWYCSMIATIVRPIATPDPLSV